MIQEGVKTMSLKIEKDITKEVNTNSDNSMEVFNSRSHF